MHAPGSDDHPATAATSPEDAPSGFDRRSFLKWTAAAGAAAGLAEVTGSQRALGADGLGTMLTPQQEASRLLAQCTFGGDQALIDWVTATGLEAWLDAQMALPPSLTLPQVFQLVEDMEGFEDEFLYFDWIWWQHAMTAPDVVRHRVAWALQQIFVISRFQDVLYDSSVAVSAYHDVLARNAFGNFRNLLLDVALQPSMGVYLSHLWNRRSDPVLNRFPDENFAREVMQLFSIGLFELNADGSRVLDGRGQPIPTYTNAEITEMAKIFTGLTQAPTEPGEPILFGGEDPGEGNVWDSMVMYEDEHEPGPKTLLNGFVVPGGQTGMQDVEMAIDHLFQHPNVGPFMGRHLIQRLVTSNPTPAYISRVSAVFADNGSGVRGDMAAVIKAILMDPEARDASRIDDPNFGKAREPFTRWVQLGRAFHATSPSGQFRHFGGGLPDDSAEGVELPALAQYPFFSPSVFNFYSPTHQPAGALTDADLVAPELQIIHSYTSVATANLLYRAIVDNEYLYDSFSDDDIQLDLNTEVAVADMGPAALIDHLDLLLTYGTLSAASRTIMLDAIMPLAGEPEDQVLLALYLFSICPEYAVQR
ncbi:MAG: DUF1800 family protein [Acidobacteriota bacterium]